MGTVRADIAAPDPPAPAPPAESGASAAATPAAVPRAARQGGHCGNCGFADTGTYCSRCGEPLHGTKDTVLQIVWSDLVEGPVHNLFALLKTTWLILARPRRFFDGVLRRQHGMTHVPFFMAPVWRRVSHKPHGVPNAVKYFVLTYTLTFLGAWIVGVDVIKPIPFPLRGPDAELPGAVTEALMLLFVVCAAYVYSAVLSRLLGGKIPTELLTRFMLYLNGFALIPFVGIAVSLGHTWILLVCIAGWLYALFVLPQVSLPRIFGISRVRLGLAQAGAAVANLGLMAVMVFFAGIVADLAYPGWSRAGKTVAAAPTQPFSAFEPGLDAVRRASVNVFPIDTVATLIARMPSATPAATRERAAQAAAAAARERGYRARLAAAAAARQDSAARAAQQDSAARMAQRDTTAGAVAAAQQDSTGRTAQQDTAPRAAQQDTTPRTP
ncbi:MAG TPA: hypothetical protein VEX86_14870 [Longimicrobium sp.]|nr:hypothetical protein [Longimicrobium sp.]